MVVTLGKSRRFQSQRMLITIQGQASAKVMPLLKQGHIHEKKEKEEKKPTRAW